MNKENYIKLKDLATECDIQVSTIYNYVKQGILPSPLRIPNEEYNRGVWAVYPRSIIKRVKKIKKRLKETHSLKQLKNEFSLSPRGKNEAISTRLIHLARLAKMGKYDPKKLSQELMDTVNLVKATATTGTNLSFEPISLEGDK
ncbi:MAG: hypothetical protein ISS45_07845 [Candidatus Omnitrophica bacterium]|nr:hypothetical protein [Candidatus Omnitrophota bacterium]